MPQPAYLRNNVYAAGAQPADTEQDATILHGAVSVAITEDGDAVYLHTQLPEDFDHARTRMVTGLDLERVRLPDADYEEPDGTPATIDHDLIGQAKQHQQKYPAGPIATLTAGTTHTRIW